MPSTYTPMQAATALGRSVATVYRQARSGRLATVVEAGRIEFDAALIAEQLVHRSAAHRCSVDVATAARRLGVSRAELYRMAHRGEVDRWPMPHREVRISLESIRQWQAARGSAPAP